MLNWRFKLYCERNSVTKVSSKARSAGRFTLICSVRSQKEKFDAAQTTAAAAAADTAAAAAGED
jgi:hypothetical protein